MVGNRCREFALEGVRRLFCDVIDCARERVATIEGALWSLDDLNTGNIEHLDTNCSSARHIESIDEKTGRVVEGTCIN